MAAATRAEYVAQVDPICLDASKRTAKPIKALVKTASAFLKVATDPDASKADLKRAGQQYSNRASRGLAKVNRIFGGMLIAIVAVPAAPGDEATVAGWIDGMWSYKLTNDRAIRALRAGKLLKSLDLTEKALEALNQATQLVAGFGFRHCA